MRKLRKTAIIFGLICVFTLVLNDKLNATDPPIASDNDLPPNYAKIYVWKDNVKDQQVGHISMQTNNSYISIAADPKWEKSVIVSDNIGLKQPVFAPALKVCSYQRDLEFNKRAADHVFLIKLDAEKVDKKWAKLLKNRLGENIQDQYNQGITRLEGATWSILSEPGDVVAKLPSLSDSENSLKVSSSSIVFYALMHGGVNISQYVYPMYKSLFPRNAVKYLNEIRPFVKPCDIGECLGLYLKDKTMHKIDTELKGKKLVMTRPGLAGKQVSDEERNQIMKTMESQFPPIFNENTALTDCLSNFGTLSEINGQSVLECNPKQQQASWWTWGCVVQ